MPIHIPKAHIRAFDIQALMAAHGVPNRLQAMVGGATEAEAVETFRKDLLLAGRRALIKAGVPGPVHVQVTGVRRRPDVESEAANLVAEALARAAHDSRAKR